MTEQGSQPTATTTVVKEKPRPLSAYGVPSLSALKAPSPRAKQKLFPFEQQQLERMISSFNAMSPRVRAAYLKVISKAT